MPGVPTGYRGAAIESLNASTATGAGSIIDMEGCFTKFSYMVNLSTAGTASGTVQFQGSLDGTNFTTYTASTLSTGATNGAVLSSTSAVALQHVRLNISALGSTDTVVETGIIGASY